MRAGWGEGVRPSRKNEQKGTFQPGMKTPTSTKSRAAQCILESYVALLMRRCIVYVLLRYLSYVSQWGHSFTRLFTIVRAVLWSKLDLLDLLGCYGTAKGSFRNLARPEQAYFPGFL